MPMTFKPAYYQETVELLRTILDQAWDVYNLGRKKPYLARHH
jgi:hypothetical protein